MVAAVEQRRADWGVAISSVAHQAGLAFLPIRQENFDFVAPRERLTRPAVIAFQDLLADESILAELKTLFPTTNAAESK